MKPCEPETVVRPRLTQYCIRGNNRRTGQKEVISGPYDTQKRALEVLSYMARLYRKTHTYARVAKYKPRRK